MEVRGLMIALLGLTLLLLGCSATPASGGQGAGQSEEPTPKDASIPPGAEALVQLAKEDLSKRLGLSVSQVMVATVEEIDWPSTALGCPEPGKVYAQVITPGYKITLTTASKLYTYHTDRSKRVILCQKGD